MTIPDGLKPDDRMNVTVPAPEPQKKPIKGTNVVIDRDAALVAAQKVISQAEARLSVLETEVAIWRQRAGTAESRVAELEAQKDVSALEAELENWRQRAGIAESRAAELEAQKDASALEAEVANSNSDTWRQRAETAESRVMELEAQKDARLDQAPPPPQVIATANVIAKSFATAIAIPNPTQPLRYPTPSKEPKQQPASRSRALAHQLPGDAVAVQSPGQESQPGPTRPRTARPGPAARPEPVEYVSTLSDSDADDEVYTQGLKPWANHTICCLLLAPCSLLAACPSL